MIGFAAELGKQLVHDEHAHCAQEWLDDAEHVSRVERAVRRTLSEAGAPPVEASAAKEEVINFGRSLYIEECATACERYDNGPCDNDGSSAEFDRYLRECRR